MINICIKQKRQTHKRYLIPNYIWWCNQRQYYMRNMNCQSWWCNRLVVKPPMNISGTWSSLFERDWMSLSFWGPWAWAEIQSPCRFHVVKACDSPTAWGDVNTNAHPTRLFWGATCRGLHRPRSCTENSVRLEGVQPSQHLWNVQFVLLDWFRWSAPLLHDVMCARQKCCRCRYGSPLRICQGTMAFNDLLPRPYFSTWSFQKTSSIPSQYWCQWIL